MADRVKLADGTELDMLDPVSIRAYVRKQLALTVDPSAPQLKRLEMLEEHAAKLEAAKPKSEAAGKLQLVDAQTAAQVIRERLAQRG